MSLINFVLYLMLLIFRIDIDNDIDIIIFENMHCIYIQIYKYISTEYKYIIINMMSYFLQLK